MRRPILDESGVTNCLLLKLSWAVDKMVGPCAFGTAAVVKRFRQWWPSCKSLDNGCAKAPRSSAELLGGLWVVAVSSCELFAQEQTPLSTWFAVKSKL